MTPAGLSFISEPLQTCLVQVNVLGALCVPLAMWSRPRCVHSWLPNNSNSLNNLSCSNVLGSRGAGMSPCRAKNPQLQHLTRFLNMALIL